MAFQRKHERLQLLGADVLIIQECAHESISLASSEQGWDCFWKGDNRHKGLGIFVRRELRAKILPVEGCGIRHMLVVRAGGVSIIGFWAMSDSRNTEQRYIAQVWNGLCAVKEHLQGDVIVAGDFNWNAKFSVHGPLHGTFADVTDLLESRGLKSVYHVVHGVDYGEESASTFFMARKPDRGYHIDYVFLSGSLMESLRSFQLGTYSDWADVSDHMPLIVDIDCKRDTVANESHHSRSGWRLLRGEASAGPGSK